MILCSSLRKSSKSSPSKGSHTNTISTLSVCDCNASLMFSETVTGIFKACKEREKIDRFHNRCRQDDDR